MIAIFEMRPWKWSL